jgi:PKD repeat protein
LAVAFTDTSTGIITNLCWSFGDGFTTNTTVTDVLHTYSFPGTTKVPPYAEFRT